MSAHICDWCGFLVDWRNSIVCTCPVDPVTERRLAAQVQKRHDDAVKRAATKKARRAA